MLKFRSLVAASVIVMAAGAAVAATSRSDLEALKRDREQLQQEINAKNRELSEMRAAALRGEALAALKKAEASAAESLNEKRTKDAEIQPARKARDEARQAYEKLLAAETAAAPEGKSLEKEIEAANAKIKEAQAVIRAAQQKLDALRRAIAKQPSGKLAEANKAAEKVHAEYRALAAKKTAAEQAAYDKARAALEAKVAEALAADPKAVAARKALDELRKKEHDLNVRIRTIENPPPAPKKAEKKEDKREKDAKQEKKSKRRDR